MSDPRGRHYVPERPSPPGAMHHGGSFAKYMENKNRKLHIQFNEDAAAQAQSGAGSKLFAGISIHVNGLTSPSHQELKLIMAQHGGNFEAYYARNRVTHIICSNLTDQKVKLFKKERDPTPIVRPEWIVDSIQADVVLPVHDYQLWRLRDAPGQQALASFTAQPHTRSLLVETSPAGPQAVKGAASTVTSAQQLCSKAPAPQQPVNNSAPDGGQGRAEYAAATFADHAPGGVPAATAGTGIHEEPADGRDKHVPEGQLLGCAGAPAEPACPPEQTGKAANLAAQEVAARARAACDVLRGPPQTTRDNPDFMDTYFRSSRLHFIGTWKARIEALATRMCPDAPSPASAAPTLAGGMQRGADQRAIIHLDMDCFFASVAELTHPALKGQPLAVSHSNSAQGTGEISSANYTARQFGIHAGMFISEAKRRCPNLVVMPYLFEKFEEISEQVYRILLQHTSAVQPVSVDEAYLDVTGLGDAEGIAKSIRAAIQRETGCTASAGIASNMLLARLATKRAKPDGVHALLPQQVDPHLLGLPVGELPGVGWALQRKLAELGIETVADVRKRVKGTLQRELGEKTGQALWDAAHGLDQRQVEAPKARKSIGAEVNWGVRFQSNDDAEVFLDGVAGEVCKRLHAAGVRGRMLTLKLKRRKAGAPEPPKFMGHGSCDNLSRSLTLPRFTASEREVAVAARSLLRTLRVPAPEIRGIGIAVAKLSSDPAAGAARPSCPMPGKAAARPASQFLLGRHTPFESWLQHQANEAGTLPPLPPHMQHKQLVQSQLSPVKRQAEDGPADATTANEADGQCGLEVPAEVHGERQAADPAASGEPAQPPSSQLQRPDGPLPPAHSGSQGSGTWSSDGHMPSASELQDGGHDEQAVAAVDSPQATPLRLSQQLPALPAPVPAPPGMLESGAAARTGMHQSFLDQLNPPVEPSSSPGADPHASVDAQPLAGLPQHGTVLPEWGMDHARSVHLHPAAAAAAPAHNRAGSTPIQALPPASQLDAAVMDALPLPLKRELERAYGLGAQRSPPAKRGRGQGRGRVAAHPGPKRRRTSPSPPRQVHSGLLPAPIDPVVLAQLPEAMQKELLAGLPSHRAQPEIRDVSMSTNDPQAQLPEQMSGMGGLSNSNMEVSCQISQQAHSGWKLSAGLQEAKEIWANFYAAFEILATQAQPKKWHKRQVADASAGDPAQRLSSEVDIGLLKADALCDIIFEWGQSLLPDSLESLQYLMRRLLAIARHWRHFDRQVQHTVERLQQVAHAQYGADIHLQTVT